MSWARAIARREVEARNCSVNPGGFSGIALGCANGIPERPKITLFALCRQNAGLIADPYRQSGEWDGHIYAQRNM